MLVKSVKRNFNTVENASTVKNGKGRFSLQESRQYKTQTA
ncbi:uncharacterized protein METZ01_LOCUS145419 [marine metagenome]|uniref:Uncharacterized protein n=1 Tax=marine metagenome TaxID=408172 RepID=A0A381ZTE5_9ZZZZ